MKENHPKTRQYIRLKPETSIIVEINFADKNENCSLSGLLIDESVKGCAIASIYHPILKENLIYEVKFPKANACEIKIIHIEKLHPNLIIIGGEYV